MMQTAPDIKLFSVAFHLGVQCFHLGENPATNGSAHRMLGFLLPTIKLSNSRQGLLFLPVLGTNSL